MLRHGGAHRDWNERWAIPSRGQLLPPSMYSLVLTPARRATPDAFASGSFNAKIRRIFSTRVQY